MTHSQLSGSDQASTVPSLFKFSYEESGQFSPFHFVVPAFIVFLVIGLGNVLGY